MKYTYLLYSLFFMGLFFTSTTTNAMSCPDKIWVAEIEAAGGKVMADYSSVAVPGQDKIYYEVVFWDTKTGVSKLYFYSYDTKKFKAYGNNVQLPQSPLGQMAQGEVMMDYTSVHVPSEDKTYYEIMVWDTKTGVSKLYFYSYDTKKFKAYGDNVQLPQSPLGQMAQGEVMMDYTAIHVSSQDKTYYEVMVWNTKTGKSKLYFYSYDTKKFKAYEDNVQLPQSPLGEMAQGEVMMDYTSVHVSSEDKTYYEVMVWDTKTGKSKLYFYSYDTKKFKAYGDNVQLPQSPLGQMAQGEVMMDYTSIHVSSQDKTYYEVMVWDTKTGKSKLYEYNYTTKKFKAYGDNVQLPQSPLGQMAQGEVMMDYTSVRDASKDKTYYECLIWDDATGESKLYFYSYDDKKFKAYNASIQLSKTPLN